MNKRKIILVISLLLIVLVFIILWIQFKDKETVDFSLIVSNKVEDSNYQVVDKINNLLFSKDGYKADEYISRKEKLSKLVDSSYQMELNQILDHFVNLNLTYNNISNIKMIELSDSLYISGKLENAVIDNIDSNMPKLINRDSIDLSFAYELSKDDMIIKKFWSSLDNDYTINSKDISNDSIIVTIYALDNNKIVNEISGFYLSNGVVVTNFKIIKDSIINENNIVVMDYLGSSYSIDGIIALYDDIVVLKLDSETNNSSTIKLVNNSELLDDKIIKSDNMLLLNMGISNKEVGSPLFNQNGDVIGIMSDYIIDTPISVAQPAVELIDLQQKLQNQSFSDITYIPLDSIRRFYPIIKKEYDEYGISSTDLDHYLKIGDMKNTIDLPMLKVYKNKNIISIRYDASNVLIDSLDSFLSNYQYYLEKDGFNNILKSDQKIIYQNEHYNIVIYHELQYLIVLIIGGDS